MPAGPPCPQRSWPAPAQWARSAPFPAGDGHPVWHLCGWQGLSCLTEPCRRKAMATAGIKFSKAVLATDGPSSAAEPSPLRCLSSPGTANLHAPYRAQRKVPTAALPPSAPNLPLTSGNHHVLSTSTIHVLTALPSQQTRLVLPRWLGYSRETFGICCQNLKRKPAVNNTPLQICFY